MFRSATIRSLQAAALCGLLFSAAVPAALYRWVDADGVTVYSQAPPPEGGGEKVETRPTPAPAQPAPAQSAPTQAQPAEAAPQAGQPKPAPGKPQTPAGKPLSPAEAALAEREAQKKTALEKAKAEAERKKGCAAAKKNYETYQNLGAKQIRHADGSYERPSEGEVADRTRRAKERMNELCK